MDLMNTHPDVNRGQFVVIGEMLRAFTKQERPRLTRHVGAYGQAHREFWHTATSNQLMDIITDFQKEEGEKALMFVKGETSFWTLLRIMDKSPVFRNFEHQFFTKGQAGMGVWDHMTRIFHPCEMGEHWPTLLSILSRSYNSPYRALRIFQRSKQETVGKWSREQLDAFILANFQFVGEARALPDYVECGHARDWVHLL